MESLLRAGLLYAFLYLVFRVNGKRALADIKTFDFLLLLIIGEASQQALLGDDYSTVNAFLVIATLIGIDHGLALAKERWRRAERLLDGTPLVIVDEGRLLTERMAREGLDRHDVLAAAREAHGLERLDQIKYAVLEKHGRITIIPTAPS